MARTDYGAILSTVIKDTSDAVREVNGTSSLIAPNQWGTAIRTMHSDSDYENALEQMIEETATGDIASFSDGANNIPCPSVLCTINPVQDLHGQDYPYPAGGGKNILPFTNGKTMTENGITFLVNEDSSIKITSNGASTGISYFTYYTLKLPVGTYYLYALLNDSVWAYDASGKFRLYVAYDGNGYNFGNSFTISDASKNVTVYVQAFANKSFNDTVKLMISEGSTAPTKWSPYENICPITGHTELNVVHTGANIWDEDWELGIINSTTGEDEPNNSYIRSKGYTRVEANMSVYCVTSASLRLVFYDKDKAFVGIANGNNTVVNIPNNTKYLRFYVNNSYYGTTYNNDISINYPSTDTSYHAYTGSTTTTDLGTTVYGGTLDPVSGVLTIDRAIISNLENYTWTRGQSGSVYAFTTNLGVSTYESYSECVCSSYKWSETRYINNLPNMCLMTYLQGGTNRIAIRNDNYEEVTPFLENLSGTQLVIPLATPITTQLTPQEVKSLLGSNNIYHDCNGQVAVTYRANGELYVEQHT